MNIIDYTLNQTNTMKDWTQTHSVPQIIDTFTYDQYESSNPLRLNFSHLDNIDNKHLTTTANVAQNVGAEIISAYINPYYLSHKIINIPSNIVELYKKYSNS